jgi:asparagine synthase (glutamine-hydrolysing)
MCGIAGFVHADRDRPADPRRLRRMTDVVSYRGPDGDGFHVEGNVALGHRRLSIIDLTTGDQPMSSDDGTVTVSYNGEIYNYLELREELRSLGHVFRTESDTEVIIRAYQAWGPACQQRFNGMWAIALWDRARRRLLLSRDRLGEKPLHYAETDGTLLFASEMKSLFAWGLAPRQDPRWTEVFTCLSYLPAPHTFFHGVYKLPAGSCLIWEDGAYKVSTYWDLPATAEGDLRTDAAAVEQEFADLFTDSVRIRMRSDVPYGAFLSGGLDSSCIVAAMAGISSHAVKTFTVGFAEGRFDERPLARLVAAAFGTEHHEELVEPSVFEESLNQVRRHYDEPFGDASAIPTGLVAKCARRAVKMVLTGDGGDEALSGYTMYQGEKFAHRYGRLPRPVRSAVPALLGVLVPATRGRARFQANRWRSIAHSSAQQFDHRLIAKVAWADLRLIKSLLPASPDTVPIEEFVADLMRRCPYRDPFYRLMYYHLKISLPDRMLVKVDRMSMAHSLEVRTPFLDHRLIELLAGTHKDVKMRGMERKSILRRTVARQLPAQLLRAPKKGFAVPLGAWFRERDFATYAAGLATPGGLEVASVPLQEVLDRNRRGEEDLGNLLWSLLLLDRFYRDALPAASPVG